MNWRLVERQARHLLANWRGLLAKHVEDARPALRALLDTPLRFTPIIEDARHGFHVEGAINGSAFLAGIVRGNELGVPGRI